MLNKLFADVLLDLSEEVRKNTSFHVDKEAQSRLREELTLLSELI